MTIRIPIARGIQSFGHNAHRYFAKATAHTLAKNALWSFGGYSLQLGIQAIYFVLIARTLGSGQYGVFVATSALANILAPVVGLGSETVLLKKIAQKPEAFREYWGNALLATSASGLVAITLVLALFPLVLAKNTPLLMAACICFSDLLFVRLLEVVYSTLQGFGRFAVRAQLLLSLSVLRLIGIAGLAISGRSATAAAWSLVYLTTSFAVCSAGVIGVIARYGWPRICLPLLRKELTQGLYFSASMSSMSIYNDIDKSMMGRMSTLTATGIYAAAYRVVDYAFLPIRSLLNSAYPEFFRHGEMGIRASAKYGKRLLRYSLPYAIGISAVLFVGAPLIPLLLGSSFAEVTSALRWLALLPAIKTVHFFAADSLTGGGFQKQRTIVQGIIALLNIALNFALIPAYGWLGASWASLASDGSLAILLWIWVWRLERKPMITIPSQAGMAQL